MGARVREPAEEMQEADGVDMKLSTDPTAPKSQRQLFFCGTASNHVVALLVSPSRQRCYCDCGIAAVALREPIAGRGLLRIHEAPLKSQPVAVLFLPIHSVVRMWCAW